MEENGNWFANKDGKRVNLYLPDDEELAREILAAYRKHGYFISRQVFGRVGSDSE